MPPFIATVLDRQMAVIPLPAEQRSLHGGRSSVTTFGVVLRPQAGSEFAIVSTDANADDIRLVSSLQVGSSYTFPAVLTTSDQ
jgi:hypothetical protein